MSEGNNSNQNGNKGNNKQNSSTNNQRERFDKKVEKNWNNESLQNREKQEDEFVDEEENDIENENINEDVKDAMKTGANLAKNAATGNMLGVAKDALKLAKNKEAIKKKIKNAILQNLLPIILIIFIAGSILAIFSEVADTIQELISGAVDAIVDFFTVDETSGEIVVSDEQIDTIINSIEEMGVSAEDLKLLGDYEENATEEEKQEALRKYIRDFYEAQAVTETLNYYHTPSNDTATYGAIYLYRTTNEDTNGDGTIDNNDRIEMTYIPYEQMLAMQEAGNLEIRRYFSLDDSDNLIISSSEQIILEKGSSVDSLTEVSNTIKITLRTIDYKTAVSQYTTKMNFLIYLTMISRNPEFVSAVVDLIVNSRIELTVMDNTTTTETTNIYQYDTYMTDGEEVLDPQRVQEVTKTTVISTDPSVNITYVKTWFCEQTITYVKKENTSETTNTITMPDESTPGGRGEIWKVNQTNTIIDKVTTEIFEESVRGDVIITLGESGDGERYANGEIEAPTFIGLMETEFRIPYSTRTEAAGSNLVSGAEMLFFLLQKDAELENMETIMRYALYLYSGRDYGVTSIDGSIFEVNDNFYQVGTITGGGVSSGGSYGSGIYWWPIGSATTEVIDGVEYAKGTPVSSSITSGVGPRWGSSHNGLDISAPRGTYIIASRDGVVIASADGYGDGNINIDENSTASYGNYVKVQHSDGTVAIYAHMIAGSLRVGNGDTVKQGQVIGQMGMSGRVTGVHLHFELRDASGNILDPEEYVSQSNPRPTVTQISVDNIEQECWNYLIAKGVSEAGAAGIMGNIAQESGFDPTVVNSIGATGLCQWLGGRKDALINYAAGTERDYTDAGVQMEFLWMELCPSVQKTNGAAQQVDSSVYNSIVNATSVEEATRLFMEKFERPGSSEGMLNKRISFATQYYQAFAGS